MTPNNNTTTYNDAPEEFRNKLKCAIMELNEKDRSELLQPYVEKYYGVM